MLQCQRNNSDIYYPAALLFVLILSWSRTQTRQRSAIYRPIPPPNRTEQWEKALSCIPESLMELLGASVLETVRINQYVTDKYLLSSGYNREKSSSLPSDSYYFQNA